MSQKSFLFIHEILRRRIASQYFTQDDNIFLEKTVYYLQCVCPGFNGDHSLKETQVRKPTPRNLALPWV